MQALATLRAAHGGVPVQPAAAPVAAVTAHSGLLLADATLEDIVKHLHGLGIEPTFRHVLKS